MQKLLGKKISAFPCQQLQTKHLRRCARALRPSGAHQAQASYLDRESRRARQEGRAGGPGVVLRGEVGVFLTMR